jgi:hypothetical protein
MRRYAEARPMHSSHEAWFYEKRPGKEVLCTLCPHDCHIRDGGRGVCAVRYNHRGTLFTVVYEGNVPGEPGENTHCHHCRALLIERFGFYVRENLVVKGCCPDCGTRVDGVGMSRDEWPVVARATSVED